MPVAHLATIDAEGRPRIHPVSSHLGGDRLYVVISAASPKRRGLADRRHFALHSINIDEPGPHFDEFELLASGTACRVSSNEAATRSAVRAVCPYPIPDDDWLFELTIDRALTTVWDAIGAPDRRAHRLIVATRLARAQLASQRAITVGPIEATQTRQRCSDDPTGGGLMTLSMPRCSRAHRASRQRRRPTRLSGFGRW